MCVCADVQLGYLHIPLVHVMPVRHTVPQPPQLLGSLWRLTQTPAQFVLPRPHPQSQTPLVQKQPLGHVTPHAPQF